MTELTILLPCLNEAETLASCIAKAQGYLARSGVAGEVLVADNGSTDASPSIAARMGARVIAVGETGYGAALMAGIGAARGRYVIMGDSDDSYDFSRLDGFVKALRGGADLVMGNRFRGGIAPGAMPALHRYLGNPVLSGLGRLLYRTDVGDFHCGLRGISRAAILRLDLRATGMEFASEMVLRASLAGLSIAEVPTTLSPDGRSRPPHLRSWRDGWRHLKLLLMFAPAWLFLYPGIGLLGVGGTVFAALMHGPVRLMGTIFDTATLILASVFVLTGFQMACLAALASLFSVRFGLRPASLRYARLAGWISVDRACAVGACCLLAALTTTLAATVSWARTGFGDLDPQIIVRPTILAVVLGCIGVQAITTGFLWGLLGMKGAEARRFGGPIERASGGVGVRAG